ncbi:MAG: MobA/MobL family protein [Oscillospiraceae bacterium]
MAIYHLEAKVVSRGNGRSAVAASAYLSCTNILNDYDGVRHDYTRKKGLVWREVFLPEFAPQEWQDRGVLWNAVEENEKTKDSRLAREFVPALPVELSKEQWQRLLSDFINDQFVADGMCADVAIHDPDPPGYNPHAHIMLTVRPLDENGKWQYKTEKRISLHERQRRTRLYCRRVQSGTGRRLGKAISIQSRKKRKCI